VFVISIPRLKFQQGRWLPDGVSVFTTELVAILWALCWLGEVVQAEAVICSDSVDALEGISLGTSRARPDLIGEILNH